MKIAYNKKATKIDEALGISDDKKIQKTVVEIVSKMIRRKEDDKGKMLVEIAKSCETPEELLYAGFMFGSLLEKARSDFDHDPIGILIKMLGGI